MVNFLTVGSVVRSTLTMVNFLTVGSVVWVAISILLMLVFGSGWISITLIALLALVVIGIGLTWRMFAVRQVESFAERNLGLTYVEEGTAKFVMLGGTVANGLIQFEGHLFGSDWEVVEGIAPRPRRFFGADYFENPFVNAKKIFMYTWRRSVVDEQGNMQELRDEIDYVPLTRDVYWCQVTEAEDESLIPLNVELLLTMQVVNPYKALFRAGTIPGVWLQLIIARTTAEARNVITHKPYKDWIADARAMGDEITKLLKEGDVDVLKEFKDEYGINLLEISVLKVSPAGDYQRLATQVVEARLRGEAENALAEGQAEAFKQKVEAMRALGDDGRFYEMMGALRESSGGGNMMWMMPGLFEEMQKFGRSKDDKEA